MIKKYLASAPLYFLTALIIIAWWTLAFRPDNSTHSIHEPTVCTGLRDQLHQHFFQANLSPMERSTLQQALSGDTQLIIKLIAEWDLDAKILESHGLTGIKLLPKDAFIRSQILGRLLANCSKEQLREYEDAYRLKYIIDDAGATLSLDNAYQRFLPQTFVAASFLLALAEPDQIVAIPRGIREQTHLYSPLLTNKIRFNLDRQLSEQLYQEQPQIAFISHYSHPSTLEALRNQGVHLFTLNAVESLSDIQSALMRVGNVINRPIEAELMTIFMEAAMIAVDNRLLAADYCFGTHCASQRTLYLNYYTHYTTPSTKNLTWQLLSRLGIRHCIPEAMMARHHNEWTIPINQEQIVQYDPECMIIATTEGAAIKAHIEKTPAFQSLKAVRHNRIFFVDESIQQSPSQYIVLAYFDLAQALTHEKLNAITITNAEILTKYP